MKSDKKKKQEKKRSDDLALEELSELVDSSGVERKSPRIGTNLGDLLQQTKEKK